MKIKAIKKSILIFINYSLALFVFSIIFASNVFSAGVEITISKKVERKIRVTVLPFLALAKSQTTHILLAKEINTIVDFDIKNSGYFEIWPKDKLPQKALDQAKDFQNLDYDFWLDYGTEMVVKGVFEDNNGKINAQLYCFDMASRNVLINVAQSGNKSELRSIIHKLTGALVEKVSGRPSITTTKISYVGQSGRFKNIYYMDYDGFNQQQLTFDDNTALNPDWAKEGNAVLFMSYLQSFPFIYMKKLNENKLKLICAKPGLNAFPKVSPDGQKIAVTLSFSGNPEIYVIDFYGNVINRVTYSPSTESSPTWSNDGKRLAFVSDMSGTPQIYVKNYMNQEEQPRRVTFSGNYNTSPDWCPTAGSSILVYSSLYGRNSEISIVDVDSGNYRRVTTTLESEEDPAWAPDGIHVSYTRSLNYKSDIYFMDIRDGIPIQLTSSKNNSSSSAWGPSKQLLNQ